MLSALHYPAVHVVVSVGGGGQPPWINCRGDRPLHLTTLSNSAFHFFTLITLVPLMPFPAVRIKIMGIGRRERFHGTISIFNLIRHYHGRSVMSRYSD